MEKAATERRWFYLWVPTEKEWQIYLRPLASPCGSQNRLISTITQAPHWQRVNEGAGEVEENSSTRLVLKLGTRLLHYFGCSTCSKLKVSGTLAHHSCGIPQRAGPRVSTSEKVEESCHKMSPVSFSLSTSHLYQTASILSPLKIYTCKLEPGNSKRYREKENFMFSVLWHEEKVKSQRMKCIHQIGRNGENRLFHLMKTLRIFLCM